MRSQKGQAAMENLMTYGWAILIVVVVAGVLAYYGVFSPKVTAKTGFSQVDVVSPWNLKANGDLVIQVQNKVGQDISINKIYAGGVVADIVDVAVASGATSTAITASFAGLAGTSGSQFNIKDVAIEYTVTSSGAVLNSTGTLAGQRS